MRSSLTPAPRKRLEAAAFLGAILGCVQWNDGKQVPAWITDNPDGTRTVMFVKPVDREIVALRSSPSRPCISWMRPLLALYDQGRISDGLLVSGVMPLPNYIAPKAVIFENFERPEVQALLDDIASRPGLSKNSRSHLAFRKGLGLWDLPPDIAKQGRDAPLDLAKRVIGFANVR